MEVKNSLFYDDFFVFVVVEVVDGHSLLLHFNVQFMW